MSCMLTIPVAESTIAIANAFSCLNDRIPLWVFGAFAGKVEFICRFCVSDSFDFGALMSSSVHVDPNPPDIFFLFLPDLSVLLPFTSQRNL